MCVYIYIYTHIYKIKCQMVRIHLTGLGHVSGLQLSTAEHADSFPRGSSLQKHSTTQVYLQASCEHFSQLPSPSPLMLHHTQKITADPHQPGLSLNQKLCQFQKGQRKTENSVPRERQ